MHAADDSDPGQICLRLHTSPSSYYQTTYSMGLVRKLTLPDHPGAMRVVDPQWIDVDLLSQWITTCDATHGDQCRRSSWPRQLEATRPKYLVDALKMCVVEGDRIEAEYIALSYQWGQTQTLRNTTLVRERLLEPFSLSDWTLGRHIPQTIHDALLVVKLLGYRYLWVDALCVVSTCIHHLMQGEQQLTVLRPRMIMLSLIPNYVGCTASTTLLASPLLLPTGPTRAMDYADSKA